ncbi:MAG TPA: polysaccharide deacetylase family protein [Candidatus Dormibacteraeota bacterium]|nr:polysaccharide deacetylase family protein [Candidatus Dormibacteraeota bacterium]
MSAIRAALTFDAEHPDRPATDGNADRLLDELDRLSVRASFFIQGRWAEAYPSTARRIVAAGHLVGSHSHYHVRMPLLTADGLTTDVRDAEEAIREHAGVDPRPWFRCPFGAGADDPILVGRLAALGYREVGWHVGPEDWNPSNMAADVIRTVVAGVLEHHDGAVVLHHTWPDQTLAAIPEIVSRLRGSGVTPVGLDELPDVPGLRVEPQIVGKP